MHHCILTDYLDKFAIVYLNDILIFSPTLNEHIVHIKEVLTHLRDNSLFGKLEKCQFHCDSVEFLGFIVSANSVIMDESKTTAIRSWPIPNNIKELQSFLGLANFYCRFI